MEVGSYEVVVIQLGPLYSSLSSLFLNCCLLTTEGTVVEGGDGVVVVVRDTYGVVVVLVAEGVDGGI